MSIYCINAAYSIKSHSSQQSEFNTSKTLTAVDPRARHRGKKNLFIAICFGDKTNWFLCGSDVSEIHPFRTRKNTTTGEK